MNLGIIGFLKICKKGLKGICTAFFGILLFGLHLPADAKRVALVIGNDAYQNVRGLNKAGNDATAMARELSAAGFEVQLHRDLNYRGMVRAVETLAKRISGGDEVLVFFAGHGVQIKTGSYMLPVDIEAATESEVEKTAYGVSDLTEKLSESKAAFALVVVDACRDNPLKTSGRSVGNSRGLSAIEPPKGQMVVYSASRGQQALDQLNEKDTNPNGVFTREFIAKMRKPGVRIEDLVREVQDSVEALAQTVNHEQRPAIYNEARGNFYFYGPTTVIVSPQSPASLEPSSQSVRPGKVQNLSLADLEREEAARKEWSQWQTRMKADFDKTAAFNGSADLVAKAWDRFLGAWAEDNPNSKEDDSLRVQANQKKESAIRLLADLEREEAKRKEWSQWQARMKADFDKTAAFNGSADLVVKDWDRFLAVWAEDNPNSKEDDSLRLQANTKRESAMRLSVQQTSIPTVTFPRINTAQQSLTVASWGGAYTNSQVEAYHKPFTAKTGIKITSADWGGTLGEISAQVKSGNVKWDVVDLEAAEALKGCEEGLLEKIDPSKLPAGADGTPAAKDFIPGMILPCAIGVIVYSNVVAYDKAKYGANGPKTLEDFFNVTKFPGKRGLKKDPSVTLEWALMADGVAVNDVYKVLGTPAGVDRAFKKLDTIKSSVVWWTAGAQPPQLLASGEVVMTHSWHGRIVDANVKEKKDFALVWDGQIQIPDLYAIIKGTKNLDAAQDFVRFASSSQPLADQAKYIPYAPTRNSSLALIPASNPNKAYLPNAGHPGRSMSTNSQFWMENQDDLNKKFAAWLAK